MLVLSRKPRESIQIGGDIKLTILTTKTGSVSIGIEAPKHIAVIRSELIEKERPCQPSK